MSALLTALLNWLGPIVGKLLLDWLKDLLPKAQKKAGLTAATADDTPENRAAVLQAALDLTPKARVGKRLLLRHLKAAAEREGDLTDTDETQLKELVGLAKKE